MSEADKPKSDLPPERPEGSDRVVAGRRRLLHGGLAAGPVLMTLVSRPVLAAVTGQCTTPSGFVSLNASTVGRGVTCEGHTATYWANSSNFSQWPAGIFPTKVIGPGGHNPTAFNDIFTTNKVYPGGASLLEVLDGSAHTAPSNSTTEGVAKVIAAAYLNAASSPNLTPVLSPQLVKDMWAEYGNNGYGGAAAFSPAAGAVWSVAELLDYLSGTQS